MCQCVVEDVSQLRLNTEKHDSPKFNWVYTSFLTSLYGQDEVGHSMPSATSLSHTHTHTYDKYCNVETTCISLVPKQKIAEVHIILSLCLHEDWFMEAEVVPSYYQYTAPSEKWVVRLLVIQERSLNIVHVQQTLNKWAKEQSITAAPWV